MVSDDSHMMRFVTEALKNEAILCIVKPCDLSDICNIWNHVCRKRMASEKHDSTRKSLQTSNIIIRVDPIFKKFATLNRVMSNNETSWEYSAMFESVYMNFFGNEVGNSTPRNTYKGNNQWTMINRLKVTHMRKREITSHELIGQKRFMKSF